MRTVPLSALVTLAIVSCGCNREPGGMDDADASSDGSATSGEDCGNGQLDPGELCDDGDDKEGNGCNPDCRRSATLLGEHLLDLEGDGRAVAVVASGSNVWVGGSFSRAGADHRPFLARLDSRLRDVSTWVELTDIDALGPGEVDGLLALPDGVVIATGISAVAAGGQRWVARFDASGERSWLVPMVPMVPGDWRSPNVRFPHLALRAAGTVEVWGSGSRDRIVGVELGVDDGQIRSSYMSPELAGYYYDASVDSDGRGFALASYIGDAGTQVPKLLSVSMEAGITELSTQIPAGFHAFAGSMDGPPWLVGTVRADDGIIHPAIARIMGDGTLGAVEVLTTDVDDREVHTYPSDALVFPDGDLGISANFDLYQTQVFRVSRFTPRGERLWDRTPGRGEPRGIAFALSRADDGDVVAAGQLADASGDAKPYVVRFTP